MAKVGAKKSRQSQVAKMNAHQVEESLIVRRANLDRARAAVLMAEMNVHNEKEWIRLLEQRKQELTNDADKSGG